MIYAFMHLCDVFIDCFWFISKFLRLLFFNWLENWFRCSVMCRYEHNFFLLLDFALVFITLVTFHDILRLHFLSLVCSKSIANFEFQQVTYIRFFDGVMLVLTYTDNFGHFECSVNFWLLFYLDVLWFVFDFCLPLQFWEQEKVTAGQIWGIRWQRQHYCVVLVKNSHTNNNVWAGALSWCKS